MRSIASDLYSPVVRGSTYTPAAPVLIARNDTDRKPGATGAPRHTSDTTTAAATANAATPSQYPILRTMPASLATSHNPPATQKSRARAGTSPASAQTACAHSRRSAGTTRTEHRANHAIARLRVSITPPSGRSRRPPAAAVQPCLPRPAPQRAPPCPG